MILMRESTATECVKNNFIKLLGRSLENNI